MKHLMSTLNRLGLPSDSDTIEKFRLYRKRVLEWNEAVNLTAVRSPEAFEIKHYVDSLMICGDERMRFAERIIDVGTGAGFPGIPLAIVYPEKKFTLMDSLGKRMKIVRLLSEELGLKNVEIIHARAEDLAKKREYREQFDLCVSRAVANLSVLSEYCIPFVKQGGWFAPYKTSTAEEEIRTSEKAIEILGGRLSDRTGFTETAELSRDGESIEHVILWIEKTKNTIAKYPRKSGMPAKEPLK